MKLTPASPAEQVLGLLRGYSYRQTWTPQDCAVIQSILDEWQQEVLTLEAQLASTEETVRELRTMIESTEHSLVGRGFSFAAGSDGAS